ncbi:DUF742 domain-containing protein [Nocardia sp. NPDC059246]|uniref:DUF742 domain-containing protein n=1 Tax=unclassified Nocardia TaxID=2637762 RepID=UPI003692C74A
MTPRHEHWFEDVDGPLVRPYAVTQGRTGGLRGDLDMITQIATARFDRAVELLDPDSRRILRLCASPISIAEVAAQLNRPLMVTKILVSDLITNEFLIHRSPDTSTSGAADTHLLQTVLNGIRRL